MKYLIDTHAFIWYFIRPKKLSPAAINLLDNADNQMFISIGSLWEFSVKFSKGKLEFDGGLNSLCEQIKKAGFIILPITQAHLAETINLPFIHRDPFDRLLVAVAKAENMTVLTADENIQKYDIHFTW